MPSETKTAIQRPRICGRIRRYRRVAARREVSGLALVALLCAATAVPALASPVPGATYNGRTADGAYVVFTVSADVSQVNSYEITGVIGDTCQFSAEGNEPAFPGAPIENNAFTYGFDQVFSFSGDFDGAQSATGTYHFHRDAIGKQPACDSGVVSWTASTTDEPTVTRAPPSGSPSPTGSSSCPRGCASSSSQFIKTRVSLHTMAFSRLGGRITASGATCTRGRIVTLWRGKRRIRSTRSGKGGSYWFARTATVRGRLVHVTVATRMVTGAICGAASSKTIGA